AHPEAPSWLTLGFGRGAVALRMLSCGEYLTLNSLGRRTGSYELSSFFSEGGAFSVFSGEEQMILHVKVTLGSPSTTSLMPKSAKEGRT
ncbi:hypothetical protein B296_00000739, partial [Ensete ventricosum]